MPNPFCERGHYFDHETERCLECPPGEYNHGTTNRVVEMCYKIPPNESFMFWNSTDVICSPYWMGKPFYDDGEYEGGCVDAGEPSVSPTSEPSSSPTLVPSVVCDKCMHRKRTRYPTRWPTRFPTSWPSLSPTFLPTLSPSLNPSLAPTFNPSIDFCNPRFHLICSFYEHRISLPTVCYACVEAVVNNTLFPSTSPSFFPSEQPTTISPTFSPIISPTFSPTRTFSPSWSPSLTPLPEEHGHHSDEHSDHITRCSSVCCYGWVIFVGVLGLWLFSSFIIKKWRRRRRPILEDNGVIMVNLNTREGLTENLPKNDSMRITNVVQS